ncbi:MAG: hypothetical protein P8J87_14980 [Verrucomicrobiales bacterium]|nr:hypothetical protein [Verrucomicrobiales bacterium]
MKRLITLLSAAFALAVAAPTEARAGHQDHGCSHQRQVSTCGHCHRPVMAQKQFAGYDCHGCPVYRWVTIRHSHCEHAAYLERQRHARHSRGHNSHAGHGHDSHARHGNSSRRPSFRPPTPHDIIGRIFGRR